MINYVVVVMFIVLITLHCIAAVSCYGKLQHLCMYLANKNSYSYSLRNRFELITMSLLAPVIGIGVYYLIIKDTNCSKKHNFTVIGKINDEIDFQLINLSTSMNIWKCDKLKPDNWYCYGENEMCILCSISSHYKEMS